MQLEPYTYNSHAINDGTTYKATFPVGSDALPRASASVLRGNLAGGYARYAGHARDMMTIALQIHIEGTEAQVNTRFDTLLSYFDPRSTTPVKLIGKDAANSDKQWYRYCTVNQVSRDVYNTVTVVLLAHDAEWIAETLTSSTWAVSSSGATKNLSVGGNAPALPVIKITPDSAKSPAAGFRYSQFVKLRVPAASLGYIDAEYMVELTGGWDTAALVTAGKMQADGDDLRVYVNGVEVDRWLYGINTSATKVWIKIPSLAFWEADLDTALASTGAVTEITWKNTPVGELPERGFVLIDSEVFTFTDYNLEDQVLSGVTRAVKGSSMAAHSTSAKIYLLPADVVIKYGDASLSAPTISGLEPMFSLNSTNTSWVYTNFADTTANDGKAGRWKRVTNGATTGEHYTGDQYTTDDDVPEIGLRAVDMNSYGLAWQSPTCPVSGYAFTNGEKYALSNVNDFGFTIATVGRSPSEAYTDIAVPSTIATWEAWTQSGSISASPGKALAIMTIPGINPTPAETRCEVADATLTLHSDYVPQTGLVGEVVVYHLSARIKNTTTGDYIRVNYTIPLDEQLVIDTAAKEVTNMEDNTKAPGAIRLNDYTRAEWLPLSPGVTNTLEYTEASLTDVDLVIEYRERML